METDNRISLVNLGCFKNNVDSEVLAGLLEEQGFEVVSSVEESRWQIINTCGFIQPAKEESIEAILQALEKKESGQIRYLVVFGCLIQRYYSEFRENFPNIDILWGVDDLPALARAIKKKRFHSGYGQRDLFLYDHRYRRPPLFSDRFNFIKISEGCSMTCSFCAIPRIRGPYRSRALDSVVEEARHYAALGIQELNLISQNSTGFGRDSGSGSSLASLLREVARVRIPWIRVLYLMPEKVDEGLLEAFDHPRILPYFDLPFQHASSRILRSMNRSADIRASYSLIDRIRKRYSDAVIRTSFIVGFPGETREDFEILLSFARETGIERIGVFPYSDEEGTPAFLFPDKVPPGEIEERRLRLMDISDRNVQRYNRSLIGRIIEFLPLEPSPWNSRHTLGRSASQAPEVDGFTEVSGKIDGEGKLRRIKITATENEIIYGKPVRRSSE